MRGIFDMRGILVGVVTVTVGTAFFPIEGPALSAQQAAPDQQLSAQQAAPDQQLPAFRSGVEVVTVDVGVVDKQGRPMRGLTAADFVVTVAGQQRRVVTAEFVERAVPSPSTVLANADAAQVSTNEGGGAGRLYAFIVDQNTLDLGSARRVAGAAAPFFSRLTFADRSALMLMPLGPNVSFTWAHDRVREGLQRVTGMGRQTMGWEYGSLADARDITNRNQMVLRTLGERECGTISASSAFGGGASTSGSSVASPPSGPPASGGGTAPGGDSGGGAAPATGTSPTGGGGGGGGGGGCEGSTSLLSPLPVQPGSVG
jgi:hypothetical protein